jgi:WD40 repeat protein
MKKNVDSKKNKLLELLEKEPHLDLLNLIDQDKYSILELEFQKSSIGLSLDEFVSIMLEYLDFEKSNETLTEIIVTKLIDLFKEIDVNGDELLEWREFSSHIIALSFLSKHKLGRQQIKPYRLSYENKKTRQYKSSTICLRNLKYCQQTNQVISSDLESGKFKVFDLFEERASSIFLDNEEDQKFEKLKKNDLMFRKEVNAHRKAILGMDIANIYSYRTPLLVTSSNDLNIHFWDMSSFVLAKTLSTTEIQQCVRYVPFRNGEQPLLFTGGNDYVIHIYSLENFKNIASLSGWNGFTKNKQDQKGHSQPISDIVGILEQNMFASAGMDGRICLWDIRNQKYITALTENKKKRSINNLEWISSISALLSSGSDHKVNIYNTFAKEKISSLIGHNAPVISVKWVENTFDVFSADSSGVVKLWDYRNWSCIQVW